MEGRWHVEQVELTAVLAKIAAQSCTNVPKTYAEDLQENTQRGMPEFKCPEKKELICKDPEDDITLHAKQKCRWPHAL